jgi:hypothetical protein
LHGENGIKEFQKNAIDAKEAVPLIVQVLKRVLDKVGGVLHGRLIVKELKLMLQYI